MLDVAHRRGLGVEISTRFLYREHDRRGARRNISTPTPGWCARRKRRGVGIAIGSDAHSPEGSGQRLRRHPQDCSTTRSINEVVFPVAGRLARVALRATREHLEAHAQARRHRALREAA